MASNATPPLRCAIYTRKSTEHGLELEFNSLHAQRDACEAYIKSQASQGWRALPQHYDDPAFSGGNLERPALKRLLSDIEAGKVDVIVVYKIDRLTRSLADFAKLVEAFDAKSISFVAVTQQFNTTTSMGRLTLNVLLSFAQFERELSSERVRDKVAASRKKGKWTGGTVPLGYEAKDKKLIVNAAEALTVKTVFQRYLVLKSFGKLVVDLDRRGIVTKRRKTDVKKYQGGIPFTYGPLANLLKNRIYIGEVHHDGKWFKGEHGGIIDRKTFANVQALLISKVYDRKVKRFESGALLTGKIFDDRDNHMSPSFTVKNGVRHRYYVSTALLRGRKSEAGSVPRVSALDIEGAIHQGLKKVNLPELQTPEALLARIDRLVIAPNCVTVTLTANGKAKARTIKVAWSPKEKVRYERVDGPNVSAPDLKLIQAVVRAHVWLKQLSDGTHSMIDALAKSAKLHEKVVRQNLRLAFLAPDITAAILDGRQGSLTLSQIPKTLPMDWREQRKAIGFH